MTELEGIRTVYLVGCPGRVSGEQTMGGCVEIEVGWVLGKRC